MDAQKAFKFFVNRVLEKGKAERFDSLSDTKKGQRKILVGLCHQFGPAILAKAVRPKDYSHIWEKPCFVFYESLGFGVPFDSVRGAYEELSVTDSWLIVLADGSAGIHRPEARWDDERLVSA